MSPIEQTSFRAGRTMLGALVMLVIAVVVLWGASVLLTNRHNARSEQSLSGGVVNLKSADRLLDQFQRHGNIPIYFPDVSGNGTRGVYLTHHGDRSSSGWTAFLAQVPGEVSSCQWQWNRKTNRFDASCNASKHASADGSGLSAFPVSVVKGKLYLDLRPATDTATTNAPTTS